MTQTYVQPKEIFSFQTHENHTQRKFSCPWKIMLKHPNKISTPIKIEFTQSCLHIKFSWFHTYSKNQVKIHLTMQSSTNHQYCPNLTISNNNSKMPKKKWPHNDFHPIRTISKISHKSKQQQNDNAHHKVLNKTWNQQIYQQQQQQQKKMSSPWNLSWMSVEHGCLGLEGFPLHHSILWMDDTSSHWM